MTATTPRLSLPYAEPTDARGAGADAIKALALAVEALFPDEGFAVAEAESDTTYGGGPAVAVTFPGAVARSAGFTWDGVTLTRTGPARMFTIHATVQVSAASAGAGNLAHAVAIYANGTATPGSFVRITSTEADLAQLEHVHQCTLTGVLGPGDALTVRTSGPVATTVGVVSLSAFPIGPVGQV